MAVENSSVSLRTARHVQAQRETRVTTQQLRSCLCQNTCLVRTAPSFTIHRRYGMVVWFCPPSLSVSSSTSWAPSPTSPSFSPCLPLSSCSSPSLCRCCGRASPLELLLMVFGADSRMSLCTRSTGVLWWTPLQSGRCMLSGLLLVTASRRITRAERNQENRVEVSPFAVQRTAPLAQCRSSSYMSCCDIGNDFDIIERASCPAGFSDEAVGLTMCRQCAVGTVGAKRFHCAEVLPTEVFAVCLYSLPERARRESGVVPALNVELTRLQLSIQVSRLKALSRMGTTIIGNIFRDRPCTEEKSMANFRMALCFSCVRCLNDSFCALQACIEGGGGH